MEFLIITENGTKPPSYIHSTFEAAETEAKRLCEKFNTTCKIVAVVADVAPLKKVEYVTTKHFDKVTTHRAGFNPIDQITLKEIERELPF